MTTASNEGGGAPTRRRDNGKVHEKSQLKDMCPPHKLHELDALKKKHNNDMEKVKAEIASWWEEYDDRALEEDNWQDVSKRGPKRPTRPGSGPSGVRPERGVVGGRGGSGRGGSRGGRGVSAARGVPSERRGDKAERAADSLERKREPKDEAAPASSPKCDPVPSQTAWGKRSGGVSMTNPPSEVYNVAAPIVPMENPVDIPPISFESNTPAQVSKAHNVWETKGSAHLIEAEKVKPVTVPQKQQRSRNARSTHSDMHHEDHRTASFDKTLKEPLMLNSPLITASTTEAEAIENGLSVSVNGANINAAGWKPSKSVSLIDTVQAPIPMPPARAIVDVPIRVEGPVVSDRLPAASMKNLKPKTVLNMGHWETAAGEEAGDYSFGSFGADNDMASADGDKLNTVTSGSTHQASSSTPVADSLPGSGNSSSIATSRPPPGLAIPMPANVVHVHELENKLESASLAAKKDETADKTIDSTMQDKKPVSSQLAMSHLNMPMNQLPDGFNPAFPQGAMSQTFLGAYGMGGMGMYNYNPQNFMAVPQNTAGPVLSGGLVPQQSKQQTGNVQQILPNVTSIPQPSAGAYPQPSQSNVPTDSSRINDTTPATGVAMPPGMHGTMQYNPALYYPGQQPFQMGQPHAGGYGYGYGHVQGGFGYQHMMGQGAYGQHFDEQAQHVGNMNSHHTSNSHQASYNKNSGGYRGRNPHQYSQYQGQYGYGGQPYNMAYADHFNQLGGYGPGGMDPYMSNNGYPAGVNNNFSNQDDEQQSGNKTKGSNRKFSSNPNMHQYQQGATGFNDGSSANGPSSYQGGWNGTGL